METVATQHRRRDRAPRPPNGDTANGWAVRQSNTARHRPDYQPV